MFRFFFRWRFIYRMIFLFFLAAFLGMLAVLLSDWRIDHFGEPYVYDRIEDIPRNRVGLVLGTSKHLRDGRENLYFNYRIEAAVRLYKANKIEYILVSGDNRHHSYNEPRDMQQALIQRGVPQDRIVLDYAGFRTLDSVIRAKEIFNQGRITIISQEFHNKRAIYIAKTHQISAIGFNARDVDLHSGLKTKLREKLARVLVFIDLYLLKTQPHFLGERIKIG